MKTLFIDCGMGAAGDMLTGALLELFSDSEEVVRELNSLGLPETEYKAENVLKLGVTGTHMTVTVKGQVEEVHDSHEHHHDHDHGDDHDHRHEHHHASMHNIEEIVRTLSVSSKVKEDVLGIYGIIAGAESAVHGLPVTEIHFHEVGTMDAIADVTAAAFLMNKLAPERVVASPVRTGYGHVRCAHGILPVPGPATALILSGIPTYAGELEGEFCTPTGAAILKYYAQEYSNQPVMTVETCGYGFGTKDFGILNAVRVMLGETREEAAEISRLECNVDDMTGEALGFAAKTLLEAGALDVYTIPIGMKKSRPAVLLSVLCKKSDEMRMAELVLMHTTSIGVRVSEHRRYKLEREMKTLPTSYGPIRIKHTWGFGVDRWKPEYDDVSRAALKQGISFDEMKERVLRELSLE